MLDPTVLVHVYDRRGENAPSRCAQDLPPLRDLLSALVARVHVGSLVTSAFAHRKAGFLIYCDGSIFVVVELWVLPPMSVACVRASVALSVSYLLDTGDPEGPFFMAKGAETDRSCDLAWGVGTWKPGEGQLPLEKYRSQLVAEVARVCKKVGCTCVRR